MYFKKNWGSVVEKGPPLGHIDIFQTSPIQFPASPCTRQSSPENGSTPPAHHR